MNKHSDDSNAAHRTPARRTVRPPIQWPERQATTDSERAAEFARRTVDRTYLRDGEPNTPPKKKQQVIEPPSTEHTPTADTPTIEHHTMREEPYDWNTYHSAWQQYYQQYFYRYYASWWQQQRQQMENNRQATQPQQNVLSPQQPQESQNANTVQAIRSSIRAKAARAAKKIHTSSHFKPLLSAITVAVVFLSINYNQVMIGAVKQYVSPGNVVTTPVIVEPNMSAVSQEPKIIIPKIGVEAPVVYDEPRVDEVSYQAALERGVVRLGNTANPGTVGNVVIGGHSSNNVFNPGRYKYVFVNLKQLQVGDIFYLHFNGVRYTYKVTVANKIIAPTETSVLNPTAKPTVTLFTCDPPGTNVNRLIVQGEQIDPDPAEADVNENKQTTNSTSNPLPSVAPSLWDRLFGN